MEKELTKDDLKRIASLCNDASEFYERSLAASKARPSDELKSKAFDYYAELWVELDEEKAWNKYKKVIIPILLSRVETKGLWYECWIDLEECWLDMWKSSLRLMDDGVIIEYCIKYLIERDRYYFSPTWEHNMNKMISGAFD